MKTKQVGEIKKAPTPIASMTADLKRLNEFLSKGHTLEEAAQQGLIRMARVELKPVSEHAEQAKKARESLKLSQPEFAAFLGVSPQLVKAWEQGRRNPAPPVRVMLRHIAAKPKQWAAFVSSENEPQR